MTHWLEEKENNRKSEIGKDLEISKSGLQLNVDQNKDRIVDFMQKLQLLFDKLEAAMDEDFKFHRESNSSHGIIDCERIRFEAINVSQPKVFMRRADIILCDNPGEVVFELYRAKRDKDTQPWKFHDEQKITCGIEKLNHEVAYELIDWFAWKNFFPRGIRK